MSTPVTRLLPKLLWAGLIAEVAILLLAYWQSNQQLLYALRIAARLSGRLSLFFFGLYVIHALYRQSLQPGSTVLHEKYILARNFAIVHVIHLGILLAALHFNNMELPLLRLVPGIITYMIILFTPLVYRGLFFSNIPLPVVERVFVAASGLLFLFTYAARISGKSSFATGSRLSYILFGSGTVILLLCFVFRRYITTRMNR